MKYNIPELPGIYVNAQEEGLFTWPLTVAIRATGLICAVVFSDAETLMYENGGLIPTWSHKFDSVQDAIDVVCQRLMLGEFA